MKVTFRVLFENQIELPDDFFEDCDFTEEQVEKLDKYLEENPVMLGSEVKVTAHDSDIVGFEWMAELDD